ncbi:Hypothetical predicted protein [Mytilus galloprovincialis]|uniref:Uncharacterized protein n=1 Tax=Mytilus galloprovincialis TaxID=29158 RepID=A0A8B6BNM4_MYTGA|nr:Hypothetical predicted protein [Mytilus galloprovincialis]
MHLCFTDVMPTVSVPIAHNIHDANSRIKTFACCGSVTASEKLFAQEGFVKRNDGLVECISCGAMTKVVQDLPWSICAIGRLHLVGCRVKCSEMEYVFRRANFIQTRVPRGSNTLSEDAVQTILSMGFEKKVVMLAANQFFVDYGAFPEIHHLVEYILRYC